MRRPIPSLSWFEKCMKSFGESIPSPVPQQVSGLRAHRYSERTAQQACYLKFTRYVSNLAAGKLLAENGFFQELCVLQRALDEIHEDILYLALPFFGLEKPVDYIRYLEIFWEEEPSFKEFSAHQRNRDQVPRKKIRAFISQGINSERPDHQAIMVSKYISRLLSGYVHCAAPQCLEQYDPGQDTFRVSGYPDSPLSEDHFHDFENQFFRGVLNVFYVARALGVDRLEKEALEIHGELMPHFEKS